ncbi:MULTISPECIES: DUF3810 domain-containing protein [unclassified Saccharicrinis]|uniref:DUF3810 domain-containing protein n=1 Tax=unclassified Saccharicrinis TaxID=2646859 RepID=UPI003D3593A8
MQIKPSYIKKSIPFILVALTFLLQIIFKNNPSLTERFYSTGIYPFIARVLSAISGLVPFSLDDVFYVCLILVLLAGSSMVIFRKMKFKKYLLSVLQITALVYISFYWLWGFNYYREPAHNRFHLNRSHANDSTFVSMFNRIIEETNNSYTPSSGFHKDTYDSVLENSYKNLSHYLNLNHSMGKRRIKHITFSNFFAKATILGYYGPFFNETHINKHLTVWDIPVVSAHEKSHQLGVTSEAEASFYGWLICVSSDEPFVQYSGWLYAMDYFMHQSSRLEKRKELIKKIRPEVIEDIKTRNKHWRGWRNAKIDKAASKVNDAYLKSNSIEKGIDDYNGVVQLIIDYLLQNG